MKTLLIALLLSVNAHAGTMTAQQIKDVDIRPLTDFANAHYVHVLKKPLYVWHWFNSGGHNALWGTAFQSTTQAGLIHVQNMAANYWQNYCSHNHPEMNPADCSPSSFPGEDNNMFGPGLYLAVDPVNTSSYGVGDGWVLVQIRLRAGFRYLTILNSETWKLPNEAQNVISAFGCSEKEVPHSPSGTPLYNMMEVREHKDADSCMLGFRRILKEGLKLDGLFYQYGASQVAGCEISDTSNEPALLLMDDKSLSADDVRVFNAKTTDDVEDRLRIQSFFYKTDHEDPAAGSWQYLQTLSFPDRPGLAPVAVTANNGKHQPMIAVSFYDPITNSRLGNIQVAVSPRPLGPYPTTISAKYIPFNQDISPTKLLWPDLESKPTDPGLDEWVKTNTYACRAKDL